LSKLIKAHLAIIAANIIYGLNYVIAKGIMPDFLVPRAIIFIRLAGATLILWALQSLLPSVKVDKKDFIKLFICALFGVALNQVLFFEGLNLTTPINASIIITVIPIMVLIFAHFIIKERITFLKLTGIVMGATGAILVILSSGKISLHSGTFIGNVLIFINAASYGFYLVLVKPLMQKYDPVTVIKWIFLFGFLITTPFTFKHIYNSDLSAIPPAIWGSIIYVVLASTVLAYLLNTYALKTVSPTLTGIYIYLQPLLASLVSIISGKDKITAINVIASLLIVLGVYLVSKRQNAAKAMPEIFSK
jgi:drug/metabolite transporter (DMT)-like permease